MVSSKGTASIALSTLPSGFRRHSPTSLASSSTSSTSLTASVMETT